MILASDRRLSENSTLRRAVSVIRQALPFGESARPGPRALPPPVLPGPLPHDVVLDADAIGAQLLEAPADPRLRARLREHRELRRPNWRLPSRHLGTVLRKVPLLSLLGELAVEELCASARWRAYADGTELFTEGEPARSVYLVTAGGVRLDVRGPTGWRDLPDRAFMDLVGLCGAAPLGKRQARARASGRLSVLELDAGLLAERLAASPAARHLASAITHDRTLSRLLAMTPFADAIGASGREKIVRRFDRVSLDRGERVVSPGEVRNGLWLVKSGKIAVMKRKGTGHSAIAVVGPGCYFGSISGLRGKPVDAVAVAIEPTEARVLPHLAMHKVFAEHPTARGMTAILHAEGRLLDGHFYAGACVL